MAGFKLSGAMINLVWVIALFAIWMLGTSFSLPTPAEIPEAWLKLVTQEGLLYELWISMRLNIEAILLSTVISVSLAWATAYSQFRFPVTVLTKFRFFGLAGFVIIFTRLFGGEHALKVALLVFGMSVFYLTSMVDVVGSVTKAEYDHTRSLRMSKLRGIWEVVIRGRLDQTFDVARQNAAIGWMMLTMVEGLVRFEGGVGVIMLNESKYRNMAAIFACQLTILFVGILQDRLLLWLKNVVCPHSRLVLENK